MKKIKKIASFIMALSATVLPLSAELSPLTGNSEEIKPSIFEFEEKEGVTEDGFRWYLTPWGDCNVLSYEGTDSDVFFPRSIDGYEVCEVPSKLFADNQTIKTVDVSRCSRISNGFFENSSVETVILPTNLQVIPSNLFKNCKNLKHVEFGKNIQVIPESAFEGTDYVLPDELAALVRNVNNNGGYCIVIGDWTYVLNGKNAEMREYHGNDTDIVIPEAIDNRTVTDVSYDVFNSDEIEIVNSIVYPETIKRFSGIDLKNPEKLKSITFKSDEIILDESMSDLGIEEMTFPLLKRELDAKEYTLKSGYYKNAEYIKKIHFDKGKGDFKVEKGAFENCPVLDTITFSGYDTVTLDKNSFNNTSLRRLEFNSNCKFTTGMFKDCNNLQEILLNGDVSAVSGSFKDSPLNNVIIADDSISVAVGTFDSCKTIMNVNSEPAFDSETGELNEKNKDLIIKYFGGADDVGFVNDYVMWHVKDVVSKYTNDSMSDMEKAKVLHDWVCENVSYSPKEYAAAEDHNDLSPFLTGVTVCDGYARSYNLLLHEAGIETMLVNSPDHIWNVIKLGGHYFHVDTTWDDGDKYSHNWFLKSDNEVKAETRSHSQWTLKTASSLHDFQSTVLPECSYSMGDCNMDGYVSVADAVKMNRYLMGANAVDPDDLVLYDLDLSGSVDVFDMIILRQNLS